MDFNFIEKRLIDCFNVSSDQVWYLGKNIQTGLLEYSLKIDSLNPTIITQWAKYFPAGSYFGVSKESNQKMMTLIISISENDYSEIFHFNNLKVEKGQVVTA